MSYQIKVLIDGNQQVEFDCRIIETGNYFEVQKTFETSKIEMYLNNTNLSVKILKDGKEIFDKKDPNIIFLPMTNYFTIFI